MKTRYVKIALWALIAGLATMIIIFSLLSAPIADDWSFYSAAQKQPLWEYIARCMDHTGRIGQWALIWFGFKIFGMSAVRILPAAMFIMIAGLLVWLIKQLNIGKKNLFMLQIIHQQKNVHQLIVKEKLMI